MSNPNITTSTITDRLAMLIYSDSRNTESVFRQTDPEITERDVVYLIYEEGAGLDEGMEFEIKVTKKRCVK